MARKDGNTGLRLYKLSWQEDNGVITDYCQHFTSLEAAEYDYDILIEKETITIMKIEILFLKSQPSKKLICDMLNKENVFLRTNTLRVGYRSLPTF
ncbi:MAG: hypothetical protein GY804_09670 [Alphaproteobacteria bacterium]|nr:hypothetical protein [Alphaproteobacteria bacterium]